MLAGYYLHHRRSLDLDFFSDEVLDDLLIAKEIKEIAEKTRIRSTRYVRYPSRSQYFLVTATEELKTFFEAASSRYLRRHLQP